METKFFGSTTCVTFFFSLTSGNFVTVSPPKPWSLETEICSKLVWDGTKGTKVKQVTWIKSSGSSEPNHHFQASNPITSQHQWLWSTKTEGTAKLQHPSAKNLKRFLHHKGGIPVKIFLEGWSSIKKNL